MNRDPTIIIAGPNGAGKTTFALEFLPQEAQCPAFINARARSGVAGDGGLHSALANLCRRTYQLKTPRHRYEKEI